MTTRKQRLDAIKRERGYEYAESAVLHLLNTISDKAEHKRIEALLTILRTARLESRLALPS